MSLPRSCQNEGKEGKPAHGPLSPFVLAPEAALGAHSCATLSSAQANPIIYPNPVPNGPKNTTPVRVDFYVRQRYPFRVDFYVRQQGRRRVPEYRSHRHREEAFTPMKQSRSSPPRAVAFALREDARHGDRALHPLGPAGIAPKKHIA